MSTSNAQNDSPIPGKPIWLIRQNSDGKLEINSSALKIIASIQGSVSICSVVGPYRSGKSFINNLILNRTNGFELGGSVEPCTRGIWMWDTPFKVESKSGESNFLLLDTEGLNSPGSTPELDNQIFALSILLSSYLVYNTKDRIDRDAIRKLAIIADLSQYIIDSMTSDGSKRSGATSKIKFNWVLRDFFLSLDKTPSQYLDDCLNNERNDRDNKQIDEVNNIRKLIKASFQKLECTCLPCPIDSGLNGRSREDTLQHLDKFDFRLLKRAFQEGITKLSKQIKMEIEPKSAFGILLNGAAYSNYIERILVPLNNNERVRLTDSLMESIKYLAEITVKEAVGCYQIDMDNIFKNSNKVMTKTAFEAQHQTLFNKSEVIMRDKLGEEKEITKIYYERFRKEVNDLHVSFQRRREDAQLLQEQNLKIENQQKKLSEFEEKSREQNQKIENQNAKIKESAKSIKSLIEKQEDLEEKIRKKDKKLDKLKDKLDDVKIDLNSKKPEPQIIYVPEKPKEESIIEKIFKKPTGGFFLPGYLKF